MMEPASIGLACSHPGERATLTEWLNQAGYDPVAVPDLGRLSEDLRTRAIEALIADVALVPPGDLAGLVRRLGINRPLVLLGDPGRLGGAMSRDLSVVERPLSKEALLLSVALALAEGRPARQHLRKRIGRIAASAHGMEVTLREVSPGGVGFDIAASKHVALPPYFTLRVPDFGVVVMVRRAWVAPAGPLVRCGGTVEGDLAGAARSWVDFTQEVPAQAVSARKPLQ